MKWKPIVLTRKEQAAFVRVFSKKARFLLDEDVDPGLASPLRDRGWNVETAREAGLKGHPDENILAYAMRDNRILIAHDQGYLDDRRFPPHRNPGVVVLPQGEGASINALVAILPIVGKYRELFRAAKIQLDADGTMKIRASDFQGRRRTTRYRNLRGRHAEYWEEDSGGD